MIKFNFNCEVHAENILEAFTKLGLNPFQANGEGVKITCENIELQGAGPDVAPETSSKKGQTRAKKENVAAPEVKPEPKPEPKVETAPIESTKTLGSSFEM